MSNLTKNIKKYLVMKVVDIIEILIFIVVMLYSLKLFSNIIWVIVWVLVVLFFFVIVQKETEFRFTRWEVPEMNQTEKENYHLTDSVYSVVISIIILVIFYRFVDIKILIGILVVIFVFKEIRKWRRFKKEINTDTRHTELDFDVKEIQENIMGNMEDKKNGN